MHMIEFKPAFDSRQRAFVGLAQLVLRIEDIVQSLDGDTCLLEVRPQLGKSHDWLSE